MLHRLRRAGVRQGVQEDRGQEEAGEGPEQVQRGQDRVGGQGPTRLQIGHRRDKKMPRQVWNYRHGQK